MKTNKQKIIRVVLGSEIILFTYFFYAGATGLGVIRELETQNKDMEQRIVKEQHELDALQEKLVLWQTEPFLKEKIAREHLHMARKDDVIVLTE